MKVSEFLSAKNIPPFLLGAFFGRFEFSENQNAFYTYSAYKNAQIYSNKSLCEQSKENYVGQLNQICKNFPFWERNCGKFSHADVVFALENDLNLTRDSFFNRLNRKIYSSDFIFAEGLTEEKRMFIRAFCELRGSIDRNRRLLAMDYVYYSRAETKRIRLLIDHLNVPKSYANYNFRECQPDFVSGRARRQTQFRVNLLWYAHEIGFINDYKAAIFENVMNYESKQKIGLVTRFQNYLPAESDDSAFESRLNYYINNIEGRDITQDDIRRFKEFIGILEQEGNEDFRRDSNIVNAVRFYSPDECACCKGHYELKDRTCILRGTTRYYLEIHHVISVGKNRELDDIDNLAKVCPVCHATLKRGRASETTQKQLIVNILQNKENVKDFCESYFDETNTDLVVDKIFQCLN